MTDAEKLYARLSALQLLSKAIEAAQAGPVNCIMAAEYYRLCAAITARQTETLLELAKIMQEKTEMVKMKGLES